MIVLRALEQVVLKTRDEKQDNCTKLVDTSSRTNSLDGYHGLRLTVVLVVTQNVLRHHSFEQLQCSYCRY